MSGRRSWYKTRHPSAGIIADRLATATGRTAETVYDDLAIEITDADGKRICLLWMPTSDEDGGKPLPLDHLYLWGRTGEEHRAPDSTGVDELVRLVVPTLCRRSWPDERTRRSPCSYDAEGRPLIHTDTDLSEDDA